LSGKLRWEKKLIPTIGSLGRNSEKVDVNHKSPILFRSKSKQRKKKNRRGKERMRGGI